VFFPKRNFPFDPFKKLFKSGQVDLLKLSKKYTLFNLSTSLRFRLWLGLIPSLLLAWLLTAFISHHEANRLVRELLEPQSTPHSLHPSTASLARESNTTQGLNSKIHGEKDHLAHQIALRIVLPALLVIPLYLVFIWLAIKMGLRPLEKIKQAIHARNQDNLTPLDTKPVSTEIQPLVLELNKLFNRLNSGFENEKRFTSYAAHELKTPLAAIKVHAQIAQKTTHLPTAHKALQQVLLGVNRANHCVNQLLTLSRLDPEQQHYIFQDHSLAHLTCTVISSLENSDISSLGRIVGSSYTADQQNQNDSIRAIEDYILILIRNLFDNALRYSPPNSIVAWSIRSENKCVVLQISDQGPGIPPAEKTKVWERFYRLDQNTSPGSGLGLSIVARIIEIHQGTIQLTDNTPQGLRVDVFLPRIIL